ncbi:hypothetical protein CYMTET_55525 [Cymbomonas tetramitiformis]|uniref:Uncharacterized protein n=1 Tax=Cymbomonas tetramitiformis TaxID=36881 RepID=A0AAE0BD64_9CHLO|nr:hypothetical protein CYMTET_55525 [Cymbomonas tetramitiformis]
MAQYLTNRIKKTRSPDRKAAQRKDHLICHEYNLSLRRGKTYVEDMITDIYEPVCKDLCAANNIDMARPFGSPQSKENRVGTPSLPTPRENISQPAPRGSTPPTPSTFPVGSSPTTPQFSAAIPSMFSFDSAALPPRRYSHPPAHRQHPSDDLTFQTLTRPAVPQCRPPLAEVQQQRRAPTPDPELELQLETEETGGPHVSRPDADVGQQQRGPSLQPAEAGQTEEAPGMQPEFANNGNTVNLEAAVEQAMAKQRQQTAEKAAKAAAKVAAKEALKSEKAAAVAAKAAKAKATAAAKAAKATASAAAKAAKATATAAAKADKATASAAEKAATATAAAGAKAPGAAQPARTQKRPRSPNEYEVQRANLIKK